MAQHGTDCNFDFNCQGLAVSSALLWLQDEYIEAMLAKVKDIYVTAYDIHNHAMIRVVRLPAFPPAPLALSRCAHRTSDNVVLQIDACS